MHLSSLLELLGAILCECNGNCVVKCKKRDSGVVCWARDLIGDAKARIVRSIERWFDFIILLPGISAESGRHSEVDQICCRSLSSNIAGSVTS